ncbi:bifunctional folylpolyglutamate synthase/dihydrofolate synthase [Sphingomonas sp. GlSt437]|uniref:bifunctional folylpolyglutamate synthase/dihydrofolate synthase n=2 Tax=Bacteria TaxID=2 RepID=UPI003A8A2F2E
MPDHARSSSPAVQTQLDRLWALGPGADVLGLDRITRLLARIGNPERGLPPVFHVAGTNGKGSTCAFLRAMLEAAGHRVHVYTSPHLVRFNERIRLAGRLIEDDALAPLLAEVLDAGGDIGASFFEVTTAAAFLAFSRVPADACVIEVGLGGRLDATNVIPAPVVTGIAQLGIDHEAFLLVPEAGTPEEPIARIAFEKAGIAKPDVPLVTQAYVPAARDAVLDVAQARRAMPLMRDEMWHAASSDGRLAYRDATGALDLPLPHLPGSHQTDNAALAVAMLRHQSAIAVPAEAIAAGIVAARWPARLQQLGPGPLVDRLGGRAVWIDGGHNADGAQAVARAMAPMAPLGLVFALMANRRIDDVLGPIAPLVAYAHFVPITGHAGHDPRDIAMVAQSRLGLSTSAPAFSLDQAIDRLAADPATPANVLIAGSLYLAGEALALNREWPD